jgi:hypothetical protein
MKYAFVLLLSVSAFAQSPKRLFIEPKVVTVTPSGFLAGAGCAMSESAGTHNANCDPHERDVSLDLTGDISKDCPDVITVTSNAETADYRLRINRGASPLFNSKGDVVYVSHTRRKLGDLGKDICKYLSSH